MEEKAKKRRDWIKNVTIVFLLIMLLLTFFSNTIMNYSLPEVSAQYSSSGNVSSKIRGTTTVEAVEPYNVKLEETRKIKEVKVHTGDTIKEGQVLFVLGESDGSSLEEAEEELDNARLAYEQKLIENSPDYSSTNLDIRYAKEDYKEAVEDYKSGKKKYNSFSEKIAILTEEKEEAEDTVQTYTDKKADYTRQSEKLGRKKPDVSAEATELEKAKDAYSMLSDLAGTDTENSYKLGLLAAQKAVEKAQKALDTATKEKQAIIDAEIEGIQDKIYDVDKKLAEANKSLTAKTAELEEVKSKQTAISLKELQDKIDTNKRAYEKLVTDLKKIQNEDSTKQSALQVELTGMDKKIKRMEKKVARLNQSHDTNEVTSKVAGIVNTVNYVAGDTTTADVPLAVVELTDRGYCAKLSVNNDQAKQVQEGNIADILNVWGEEIKATVQSIKNDTSDPGKKRLITFNITGDVSVGQSLELSVGDKSAYYDTIVPNSAIHEDNKGKFVLAVKVKNTPLGNRYIATRLDVTILAADATSSAISGSETGSEFIITTSTKPIEPGMLVRMVEGGDA